MFSLSHNVITLTDANFSTYTQQNPYVMVKFFAPWCGHCKALAPKWEELSTKPDIKVQIAEMDCTVNTGTCGKYGVRGYPTLKLFNGATKFDYEGGREVKDFEEWFSVMTQPMFSSISDVMVDSTRDVYFIARGPSEDWAAKFEAVLGSYKGKKDVKIDFLIEKEPSLTAYREGVTVKYTGNLSSQPLVERFVKNNKYTFLPMIGEGYEDLTQSPMKHCLLLVLDPIEHAAEITQLKQLDRAANVDGDKELAKFKKYAISRVDMEKDSRFLGQFTEPEVLPPYAVFYDGKVEDKRRYIKFQLGDDIVASVKELVEKHAAGQIKLNVIEEKKDKKDL